MTQKPIEEIRKLKRQAEEKRIKMAAHLLKTSREAERVSSFIQEFWDDWDHYEDRIEFVRDSAQFCLDLFTEFDKLNREISRIRIEQRKAQQKDSPEGGKDD